MFALAFIGYTSVAQDHPSLILTTQGLQEISDGLGLAPAYDDYLSTVRQEVDNAIARGVDVPVPKDLAGGYSHETHKDNYIILRKAGLLFQILKEDRYARFIRDVLFDYRDLYASIGRHPATRSYARGKLFWQCLNDANWLVYVSQAYDCIYDWLPEEESETLNRELFRPMADFLSVETPQFFNRIHNHSTWGNAAVGMIGLVMDDEELVDRALYGTEIPDGSEALTDNDGGQVFGDEKGFLAQINLTFSPDGYYTEGPYYQRYALYPYLIFAQALQNKRPDLDIFNYRNGVLFKSVYALLNMTTDNGEFFPVNDSQKGMSIKAPELITAVNIAYYYGTQDPSLLSIAQAQPYVSLDQTGMKVARDLEQREYPAFEYKSIAYTDGPDGKDGGLAILRARNGTLDVVFKNSRHGMGHGHFDRLNYILYNGPDEIVQDYGAARWVNIEQKDGGGYLKENKTWAKHTIAHNTVTVDGKSQFSGNQQVADETPPQPFTFVTDKPGLQFVSAREDAAYDEVSLQRTLVLLDDPELSNPLFLDLFSVQSDSDHQLDLPLYYNGEIMEFSFTNLNPDTLLILGTGHGYEHLWVEGISPDPGNPAVISWKNGEHFYTLTRSMEDSDQVLFTRIGANDPNFNLRRDGGILIRRKAATTTFISVLEAHGYYSPVTERPLNATGTVAGITLIHSGPDYSILKLTLSNNRQWTIALATRAGAAAMDHALSVNGREYTWHGAFEIFKEKPDSNN